MSETCSKSTVKIPQRRQGHHSGIFSVNLDQILQTDLVFVEIEQAKADWARQ